MIDPKTAHDMYYKMCLSREVNDELVKLKEADEIWGPIHLNAGQEAIGVGACAALQPDDFIVSNHRGYAHWIGKGIDLQGMVDEIFGKASGLCKGKGGEMLLADIPHGIMTSSIVGGSLGLATGLGLAMKMQASGRVSVAFFGEGASNTGIFHESLNFAALHNLPVIYICENNGWALSTSASVSTSVPDIAVRASSYGIRGYVVDGNDALEVYDLVSGTVEAVRAGAGPILIEAKTYRVGSFSTNDRASGYQGTELTKRWMAKDPIARLATQMKLLEIASADDLNSTLASSRSDAQNAIASAQEADYPKETELYDDLYVSA